jgi:hypothetical protein
VTVSNPGAKITKASDKYINVFGRLDSLAEPISWATGVSNMLEWLTWMTSNVLGITKTKYAEQIISWIQEDAIRGRTREETLKYVRQKLVEELKRGEQSERYALPASTIATAREALRRVKFFSEDYLNKEFDIFWILVSDKYLDAFYRQFTRIKSGGQWSTHGNSGLFHYSTGINEMQMDNLSYNETEALLVANELKLGGRKNPDQILKYALMFKRLRDKQFIVQQSRFLLLFIGGAKEDRQWGDLIEEEVTFCRSSPKSTARAACEQDVIEIARSAEHGHTSWSELIEFNKTYATTLDPQTQQVEQKLLRGFNETLSEKAFMRNRSTADTT